MLKTVRTKLKNKKNYLLTIAVRSVPDSSSYDVVKTSNVVDFINVMTYDFGSGGKTADNAPLYPLSKSSQWEKQYGNCEAAIKNWENGSAPVNKLNLGLAFYGQPYTLSNPEDYGIGASVSGDNGPLSYSKLCKLKTGWNEIWDGEEKTRYKYKDTTWIGFDNPTSIKLKVQYAKNKNFGGVMIWAVDQDDKSGICGTKFPLLKEITKNL